MHRIIAVCGVVAVVSCGGSGSAPAVPTTPTTPSVAGITVSSADVLIAGTPEMFAAKVMRSDGSSSGLSPAATWGSDAPLVATVEPSTGLVRPQGVGLATIFVDDQGVRGQKTIRVVPVYAGTWSGQVNHIQCTGAFCESAARTQLFLMTLSQNGATVVGTVTIDGRVPINATGSIGIDGILTLNGSGTQIFPNGFDETRTLSQWRTSSSGSTMLGTFVFTRESSTPAFQPQRFEVALLNVTRS